MRTLVLLSCAALAFSVLTGVLGVALDRRVRRRLLEKGAIILHPLTRHGFRRASSPLFGQALYYVELFAGFLIATLVGMLLLRAVRYVIAQWL
jgi:hypothetical protein